MSSYKLHSDEALLVLLKEKDYAAFTEIYSRYWKMLLQIAWNHTNKDDIAKDIVHEVFLSLWERYEELQIQNLAGFLSASVKFQLYKHYQKEYRRRELTQKNYVFELTTNDEEKLYAVFLQEFINGVVREMPEQCRIIFQYSRNEGLKNKEIAQKINISEKGVENTLTRALKILRVQLKNYGLITLLFTIKALIR